MHLDKDPIYAELRLALATSELPLDVSADLWSSLYDNYLDHGMQGSRDLDPSVQYRHYEPEKRFI